MARRTPKPEAQFTVSLRPLQRTCPQCGGPLWIAYNTWRKVVTLEGIFQLRIAISQCHTPTCPRYHVRSHPEEEGRWALPHGEFGLDIIALIGFWRFREHRSVPEMHQRLQSRELAITERTVTQRLAPLSANWSACTSPTASGSLAHSTTTLATSSGVGLALMVLRKSVGERPREEA